MTRSRSGGVLLALAATLALAPSALASQSEPVTITVLTQGDVNPFDATGGVVCESGTVSNGQFQFVGWQSETHAQVRIVKQFACDDGSFDILLRATVNFATCDTVATWSVLDGAGAYERLHGSGDLVGTSDCGDSILDVYTGSMHID